MGLPMVEEHLLQDKLVLPLQAKKKVQQMEKGKSESWKSDAFCTVHNRTAERQHQIIYECMAQCYKYTDCCGTIYFQSFPFNRKQIEKIEKEAKKTLDVCVKDITDEINKKILEKL